MNFEEHSLKLEDIRPGLVVYYVQVVPNKIGQLNRRHEKFVCNGFPYKNAILPDNVNDWVDILGQYPFDTERSLMDMNVVQNDYNVHRCFLTQEAADSYYEHIGNPEEWTERERNILNGWIRKIMFGDQDGYLI